MRIIPVSLLVFCFLSDVQAAFILDDFDDPAEVVSPEMENEPVVTNLTGPIPTTRTIEIAGGGVNPVASFDVGVTQSSVMSASLTELNRTDMLTPLVAFQFNYDLPPADISEQGVNNAILFDFLSIDATESPSYLRVILREDTHQSFSYEQRILDIPLNSGEFTAVMPFENFTFRGGSPGTPDLMTVTRLEFDFFFLGPSENVAWSAQIDRIRFGRIPEPRSVVILFLCFCGMASARRTNIFKSINGGHSMCKRTFSALLVLFCCFFLSLPSLAVDVQSSGEVGGPTPAQLANNLADSASNYIVVAGSATTQINATGNPDSNPRGMGTFTNGVTAQGTLLPAANQNANGDAEYEGGLGVDSGVCLCTGLITDADSQISGIPNDRGVGVEGPNNGFALASAAAPGEADFVLQLPRDEDFFNEVVLPPGVPPGSDATVLEFKVTLSSPGILSISFVHASDEHPHYSLSTYNDTPLVFIGDENGQNLENIILFRDGSGNESTLTLFDLRQCGLLLENKVAPSPAILQTSLHANVATNLHFDHEYGGFTKLLTRESACVLAPSTYTIKIVVQDVGDAFIDSATFFQENSLRLYDFMAADFDLDGDVDGDDLSILLSNFGENAPPNPKFTDGDANGDGSIDTDDLDIVLANFNQTGGNKLLCADFNRDGTVDGTDFTIWQQNNGLAECASRSEGDADGDGDVDLADRAIYDQEFGGIPSGLCGCGSTQQAASGGGGSGSAQSAPSSGGPTAAATPNSQFHSADKDEDGDVDRDDVLLWRDYFKSLE